MIIRSSCDDRLCIIQLNDHLHMMLGSCLKQVPTQPIADDHDDVVEGAIVVCRRRCHRAVAVVIVIVVLLWRIVVILPHEKRGAHTWWAHHLPGPSPRRHLTRDSRLDARRLMTASS
jgi:hypothetical protein